MIIVRCAAHAAVAIGKRPDGGDPKRYSRSAQLGGTHLRQCLVPGHVRRIFD